MITKLITLNKEKHFWIITLFHIVLVIFGKVQSKKDWYSNETCFSTVSLEKTNYIRKYSFDDDIFFESVNCAYW